MSNLIEDLKRHEGFRSHIYLDSRGFRTIGYGLNLDAGMSEDLAEHILMYMADEIAYILSIALPFWEDLSLNRRDVFINMAFNLGIAGLMKFRRMLHAAEVGDIEEVCAQMKDSHWYSKAKSRATELIEKYRQG